MTMTSHERNSVHLTIEKASAHALKERTDAAWEKLAEAYVSLLGLELADFRVREGIGGGPPRLEVLAKPDLSSITINVDLNIRGGAS